MREGLRGEDAVSGAGAVNAEDADLAGGVFRRFRVSRRKINRIGAIFGVAVAEEEIVLENGEDFVGELVDFEVRVNHVEVHWRCGHCCHFLQFEGSFFVFALERERKRKVLKGILCLCVVLLRNCDDEERSGRVGLYSEERE